LRPVPEGVTRYASLSRTNVSTTGLRLPLQPVTHQRKYYRTALLSQPATHRSKCDWTDYSAMRDRYCVTRHLPRRQPTRRADATSTRRTRSPVVETPPSSSFAIASQRSRLQRPLRQFFLHQRTYTSYLTMLWVDAPPKPPLLSTLSLRLLPQASLHLLARLPLRRAGARPRSLISALDGPALCSSCAR
jgi:hypothetical protein